ncbi:MAG: hypothetical protein LUE12_03250 [Ruminococcus sp.]|nr:hypothetical protein [Ruminococcus sp.]
MSKKTDNRLRLVLKNGETETEIATIDRRKLEMINYYIADSGGESEEKFTKSLAELSSTALNNAIDKQYKKYVPQAVRNMYEGLISKSNSFGNDE